MQLWDFSKELKTAFERAVVNEPSVFEPSKFYSSYIFAFQGIVYAHTNIFHLSITGMRQINYFSRTCHFLFTSVDKECLPIRESVCKEHLL